MAGKQRGDCDELLERVATAGRELSDAAVMYHTVLGERVGLSASQWKVLGLVEAHGPLLAGEIAERSGLKPPSVTGILDRLEGRGLVRRVGDADDGRRTWIEVDQAGVAGMYPLFAGLMARLGELYEEYTGDELAVIADFMSKAASRQRDATRELRDSAE
jgi:DNA-binding MarR family transcriptional regulator